MNQEPPNAETIPAQVVKDTYPDRDIRKLQMALIDGKVYEKGPDGIWYRLDAT